MQWTPAAQPQSGALGGEGVGAWAIMTDGLQLVGGTAITGAVFLPEIGVGWTAVGMVGVEESNAIARRRFILIVTSNWAARGHERILGGIVGGWGYSPLKDSK